MKIESSAVQMNTAYSADCTQRTVSSKEVVYTAEQSPGKTTEPGANFLSPNEQAGLLGSGQPSAALAVPVREIPSSEATSRNLRHSLFRYIIEMMHDMIKGKNFTSYSRQSDYLVSEPAPGEQIRQVFYRENTSVFYSEKESVTFATQGTVKTSDGREFSFSVDFSLSRSFMQQTGTDIWGMSEVIVYKDPLVINMEVPSAGISGQSFFFDMDGDGAAEKMASLDRGSGFLALDKNEDGIINNGGELFGAESGDGFADLAAYDEDNNGWIDENDAVFSQLKVWTKDAGGNDLLLSLKEADVGAIFLGHLSTGFHLKDSETNETQAKIQSSGIFLHESTGEAGTIQHVDFAV